MAWWGAYPVQVGKRAAWLAWQTARKIASPEELRAGLAVYRRQKPAWQAWAHPATWLRGERWADTPGERQADPVPEWTCPHRVPCGNRSACSFALTRPDKWPLK